MDALLLKAVADCINSNCHWIHVVATDDKMIYHTKYFGKLRPVVCSCMTLEVRRSHGQHYIGHRWQIAEPELHDAVNAVKKCSPAFRNRANIYEILPMDVERIIKDASHGVIELGMSDD